MQNWLLPEYVEDILPIEALHIEVMRRQIIDLLMVHGYQQVIPPLLEYLESLLSGSGSDMDLHMFKVIDQLSGRMMGLRADMTPQVARIDAHLLNSEGITRLCYANSVLHTVPSGITQTREPLQVGAELYGHSGLESDLEVQRIMLQCLSVAGVSKIHLDLGHVAVFRGLIKGASISRELEAELFAVLQAKDVSTLKELCIKLQKNTRDALMLLPQLYGDKNILIDAVKRLPDYPEIRTALNELNIVEEELKPTVDKIAFDLADLRGYHYHTGMVFAAYANGCSNAIALGGRYDEIGKAFGRARPATGFSMDLRELFRLMKPQTYPSGIRAPFQKKNKELDNIIEQLRSSGQIVVMDLPGQENESLDCNRQLVFQNGQWIVEEI
ncbi:MAG: ATP phosphoribosyltransferase regulatory subunit [Nitrosomonas sp.]|jgi:ATP phosphoribosyltransferase regulatory subunit|uniref:ATP phosphoribosyltransferase regulatory subunit n=1 Tax=Nitrosomonas sp. TaxID=42353 RepID=UPI00271FDEFC|nr:ATP phosphoribosyltransferase regulatory subunit [Nitrosomonas sp.]MDO9470130.1 ATP phosphoribosyltransferase regulatory subunit [Nitrosomonas sp.]MDP1788339.1 ATP phosphoribosyltransferase regulatory subunit [Nitrosomonas sp.]MDP2223070.1 ATP phosphoribosyltransferase regulatory subunit [Nitrosomonas sp.]